MWLALLDSRSWAPGYHSTCCVGSPPACAFHLLRKHLEVPSHQRWLLEEAALPGGADASWPKVKKRRSKGHE